MSHELSFLVIRDISEGIHSTHCKRKFLLDAATLSQRRRWLTLPTGYELRKVLQLPWLMRTEQYQSIILKLHGVGVVTTWCDKWSIILSLLLSTIYRIYRLSVFLLYIIRVYRTSTPVPCIVIEDTTPADTRSESGDTTGRSSSIVTGTVTSMATNTAAGQSALLGVRSARCSDKIVPTLLIYATLIFCSITILAKSEKFISLRLFAT